MLVFLLCFPASARTPDYERVWDTEVLPILDRYCFKCHAGVRQKSGLDLRSIETILRGGEHGPAVIPGRPDESRIVTFLDPEADPHMPPEGKKQLSTVEIARLRDWILKLPVAPEASATSTNISWLPTYVADLKRARVATEVPPEQLTPSEAIDFIMEKIWREEGIRAATVCDDLTFVRRAYLDLAGRIPLREEVETFLNDDSLQRRTILINKLLGTPEYVRHMREIFDVILLGRPKGRTETARRNNGWHIYLEHVFEHNMPWDEVVRDLILARGTNAPTRGAVQFIHERKNNHQAIAEAVAPLAFGVQIGCAQCHNHPLSWEIEQRHYWGLVAAFNRSKNVETPSGIGVSESAIGGFVQFTNLKKESQPAVMSFLSGQTIDEKRPDPNEKENDDADLYCIAPAKKGDKVEAAAVPKFSRRESLASAATRDNPMLARAFVNRVWQILIGRGIVHPVDEIDSRHRPSQPALLDWLAADFEKHGYDMKRLIRGIMGSRAYQLGASGGTSEAPVFSFARSIDKPLSAEQLTDSLLVATGNYPAASERRDELRRTLVRKFPEIFPSVYNPSLEQALFWSNSPVIDELLQPSGENTAARLAALGSVDECINQAVQLIWGRTPQPDEAAAFKELFREKPDGKAVKNLLWTLIASAEFQLNH